MAFATTIDLMMNGAESLVRTLVHNRVDVCFTNPGTSEMHFVAALDKVPGIRCVLGLFEGVVTGAADAYYRIADRPASTLLHLGPGLANGLANLHNARKAGSGIVNIVGEHAGYHIAYDAPLTSDIEGVARPMSHWVQTSRSAQDVARDGARAITEARTAPGRIATLILPADTAWNPGSEVCAAAPPPPRQLVNDDGLEAATRALEALAPQAGRCALLLGGIGTRQTALDWAGRISARTGCAILSEYNVPRTERGAGRVRARRVPYAVDPALAMLAEFDTIILVGSRVPVAFFAYPNKPSVLIRPDTRVIELARVDQDITAALENLAERLNARALPPAGVATAAPAISLAALPTGKPEPLGIGQVLAAVLPENAIVVDESVSTGRGFEAPTIGARPHDWLNVMGGSIGFGLPSGVGAAIAAPDRPVIVLEGDGSGMYTEQALWTMAREGLNVKVVVFANRAYQILKGELSQVGAGTPGERARDMLTLDRPNLDWVSLARGHGVPGRRVETLEGLAQSLLEALATPGPVLIEVLM
jgi:acetolactate synthase-1/2/3 large subunit